MDIIEKVYAGPLWIAVWVTLLMVVNTASILFIRRVEPRWVLLAWALNIPFMGFLFDQFGFVRLLGLSHIVFWTPLLIYLWMRRERWGDGTLSGRYLALVFAVNAVSLAFDSVDLARWLLGERAPMV